MTRAIVMNASSRWRGYRHLATMARGTGFLLDWPFSVTVICEDWTQRGADARAGEVDRAIRPFGGHRLPPSLGIGLRAVPFFKIGTLMVGLAGESSFPSNFTVPLSRARGIVAESQAFFAENAEDMKQRGIHAATLYLCFKGAFGMEPIIYWPDRLNVLRAATALPEHRAAFGDAEPRPVARAFAIDLRRRLVARLQKYRPAHYQTGKYYPLREAVAGHAGWSLLHGFKQQVDPQGLMNPGALGLE